MTTMTETKKSRVIKAFRDPDARWCAVMNRDRRADGAFVFGVTTTGVYCRPSCAARRARRENVTFFANVQDAARAGFRLVGRKGIFPTVPVLTKMIRRSPARLLPLHRALTRLLPVPGWCFLNLLYLRKP